MMFDLVSLKRVVYKQKEMLLPTPITDRMIYSHVTWDSKQMCTLLLMRTRPI
jgi:hypothetical protein